MSGPSYRTVDVPVRDGLLRVGVWTASAPDAPVVVAVHGVTANHLCWQQLAALDRFTVVAPDLRGRGRSSRLEGPAGIARHADDLLAVVGDRGLEGPMLVGHSMGGFVAAAFAARHPGRTAGTVLVDGGLPLPPPPSGMTAEEALNATIGPAAQRLTMRFPTPGDYLDFWRPHPALADAWTPEVEAYLRYDLEGDRSSVSLAAVRADSEGLLDPAVAAEWADALPAGTPFLRAPYGMLGEEGGLYPAWLVEEHRARYPCVDVRDVTGANHYTIVMSARGAGAVADALEEALGRSGRMEP